MSDVKLTFLGKEDINGKIIESTEERDKIEKEKMEIFRANVWLLVKYLATRWLWLVYVASWYVYVAIKKEHPTAGLLLLIGTCIASSTTIYTSYKYPMSENGSGKILSLMLLFLSTLAVNFASIGAPVAIPIILFVLFYLIFLLGWDMLAKYFCRFTLPAIYFFILFWTVLSIYKFHIL